MAALPNKNVNPILAAAANFCCCAIIGYLLLGQARKGIFPFLAVLVIGVISMAASVIPILGQIVWVCCMVLSMAVSVMAAIDSYQIADAVQKGIEVDENEYKFEFLFKIMSAVDKQAVYKG
jgi:hypothetical protein